jgi:hypothetical protein
MGKQPLFYRAEPMHGEDLVAFSYFLSVIRRKEGNTIQHVEIVDNRAGYIKEPDKPDLTYITAPRMRHYLL